MKKAIFILLLALNITPAYADEYSLIGVDGKVVNTIACTVEVCGNPNSLYSVLTLKLGERYVRTDTSLNVQKETNPFQIVTQINDDNTYQIKQVEPIKVTEDTRVVKETEREFNPETAIMTQSENAPVVKATIEIDKKLETKTPEALSELEEWWANLLAALTALFADWIWA